MVKLMEKWGNNKQRPFRQILAYSRIFRHIQAYSDISIHNQAYSGIIQAYSEPCVTLAYSKPWDIQNPGIFKTTGILKPLVYPKLWHIQNQIHIQDPAIFRTAGILRTLSIFLKVIIIFAISAFHVFWFMKQI